MTTKIKCSKCSQEIEPGLSKCPLCGGELATPAAAPVQEEVANEAREILERTLSELKTGTFKRSLLFGTGTALVSALVWFGLIIATEKEMGLIALGVGWLIGWAVYLGGWQGKKTQIAGCVLSLLAVVLGKFLYVYWITPDIMRAIMEKSPELAKNVEIKRSFSLAAMIFLPYLKVSFSMANVIFLLGAAYEGWIVPKRCAVKSLLSAVEQQGENQKEA